MTIKLVKDTELDGTVWFKVWKDDSCLKCFRDIITGESPLIGAKNAEEEATEYYNTLLENQKKGLPKTQTILTHVL